jgi:CHAT domain-containing protein
LTRAEQLNRPEDLPDALAETDLAISLDRSLPEAWFNRAIALEHLSLLSEARDAWGEYLQRDPNGPWSDEARARLAKLQQSRVSPLDADHPQSLRMTIERVMLPEGAGGVREAADAYYAATGDPIYRDVLAAHPLDEPARAAYREFRDALLAVDDDRLSEAAILLERAHAGFERLQSPFAFWCLYHLAATDYLARRYDAALAKVAVVLEVSALRQYHGLRAHALWTRALVTAARRDFSGAIPQLEEARALAARAQEVHLAGRLLNQIADLQQYLGRSHEAWRSRIQALAIAARVTDRRVRNSVYGSAANVLMRDGRTAAARLLLDAQAAANAGAAPVVTRLTLASRQAALALRDGDVSHAATFVRQSEDLLGQAADDIRYASLSNTVDLTRARLALASGDHATAITLASRAVERIAEGRDAQVADALLVRATAHAARSDAAAATSDVLRVLRLFDQRRAQPATSLFTAPDVEGLRQLTNELIASHGRTLMPAHSVRLAQAARALSSPVAPSDPRLGVPTEMPPTIAVVVYAVLPQQTVAWLLTSRGVEMVTLSVAQSELVAAVRRMSWSIRTAAIERTQTELVALHTTLAEPIVDRLPASVERLVIVPDWPLDALPFAAFQSRQSRRFLVEDYAIQFAPHLWSTAPARPAVAPSRAIVVADPDSAEAEALGLRRLRGAREEARRIEPLYQSTVALTGAEATTERLTLALNDADVVHIAAHVLVDGTDGAHSQLLLAGDSPAAALLARDVGRLPLGRVRAVILAGCGTAAADHRPHAPTTLATQFLANGPNQVAGVLWDLDDRVAASLFALVHQRLAAGRPLVEAVRDAQLQLLEEDRRTGEMRAFYTWANVVVFGLIPHSRSSNDGTDQKSAQEHQPRVRGLVDSRAGRIAGLRPRVVSSHRHRGRSATLANPADPGRSGTEGEGRFRHHSTRQSG